MEIDSEFKLNSPCYEANPNLLSKVNRYDIDGLDEQELKM